MKTKQNVLFFENPKSWPKLYVSRWFHYVKK